MLFFEISSLLPRLSIPRLLLRWFISDPPLVPFLFIHRPTKRVRREWDVDPSNEGGKYKPKERERKRGKKKMDGSCFRISCTTRSHQVYVLIVRFGSHGSFGTGTSRRMLDRCFTREKRILSVANHGKTREILVGISRFLTFSWLVRDGSGVVLVQAFVDGCEQRL